MWAASRITIRVPSRVYGRRLARAAWPKAQRTSSKDRNRQMAANCSTRKFATTSRRTVTNTTRNDYYDHQKSGSGVQPSAAQSSKDQRSFQVPLQAIQNRARNGNLYRLVSAYREHGHRKAHLDPLTIPKDQYVAELDPATYGLSNGTGPGDATSYDLTGILEAGPGRQNATFEDIVSTLEDTYCGPVAAEFQHLQDLQEREWFAERFERLRNGETLARDEKRDIAKEMLRSQAFDNFVATKFATVKRYGGEGAESMMAFFCKLFSASTSHGVDQVVMCMPHRGRLNLLTGMLQFPPVDMFRKMRGMSEIPDTAVATGDVLSHLTSSCDLDTPIGRPVHVTMIPNPSHLEAACPVAVGKTRAKQQALRLTNPPGLDGSNVLCVQIHGDAAFAAQGVIMETLAQANVPHFTVLGSVHLVVNNQLGFTTPAHWGRSSAYCTDVAKMIWAPVIHVNGDYPEEVAKVTQLALEYRQLFHKDIFIDLVCFRRWGHNEIDDPTFTNPEMYQAIHSRRSIPDLYSDRLVEEGVMSRDEVSQVVGQHLTVLNEEFAKVESRRPPVRHLLGNWKEMVQPPQAVSIWDTGLDPELLKFLGAKSVHIPADFVLHPHLQKTHVQNRLSKLRDGQGLDWATAEAMAISSLLYQGFNVRLSGQDVGRGTFSHRHAALVHQETGTIYIPLNDIVPEQKGHLEVANSILSEEAVLGFEYGMSIEDPNNLIIWEAQFGDFFNGAQIIIDTFVTSGETKWLLQSGLVMLLPHGYDGAGPEHSSCHVERFLQGCDSKESGDAVDGDDVNVHIVNPTTPAQYFHLLRRQMLRNYRRPLVVVAPKLLLRYPAAVSSLRDMAPGTGFRPVIGDVGVSPDKVLRVIACSGKHYYALDKHRQSEGITDAAIIRLESLCPFPVADLQEEFRKYPKATKFIWSQEEHQNMGAWSFVAPRFENLVGYKLRYAGRRPLATPAVGITTVHQEESKNVLLAPYL